MHEPEDTFKTGDTVALRSGGAIMTVRSHITGVLAAEQGWPKDAGYVMCDWLDADGKSNHQKFHPDQIERVVRVTDFMDNQPEHYWAFADMHGFPVDTVERKSGLCRVLSAEIGVGGVAYIADAEGNVYKVSDDAA
jgi:uncharacterized protein YodC (DUF2158 family)